MTSMPTQLRIHKQIKKNVMKIENKTKPIAEVESNLPRGWGAGCSGK